MMRCRHFVCLSVCLVACSRPGAIGARQHVLTPQTSAVEVSDHPAGGPVAAIEQNSSVASQPQSKKVAAFMQAYIQAFTLMCTAEFFDRTWFVTMISSLHHGAMVSFLASMTALGLHSVLAVLFGASVASLLPKWSMELFSALLLGVFAIIYAWECYKAEAGKDALKSRMEEAQEDTAQGSNPQAPDDSSQPANGEVATAVAATLPGKGFVSLSFIAVFVPVFAAEWGDRTQIVQITLAASSPALPVFLGSFTALALLCSSAVLLARLMEGREVSERLLNTVCFLSFGIMAAIAANNARHEFLLSHGS